MHKTYLYLSPHLDDAVLSCAGNILRQTRQEDRVVIVTVFSDGGIMRENRYESRKQEDVAAITSLGAEHLWLDFLDAPFRRPYYNSFVRIVWKRDKEDRTSYVREIETALKKLKKDMRPDKVFVPLAVGGHIDHRLTYEAASGVWTPELLCFYEDRPYVFSLGALRMRFNQLGIAAGSNYPDLSREISEEDMQGMLDSFHTQVYVREYLTGGRETDICHDWMRSLLTHKSHGKKNNPFHAMPYCFNKEILYSVLAAAAAYGSQIDGFVGSIEQFEKEIKHYTFQINHEAEYAERYWVRGQD